MKPLVILNPSAQQGKTGKRAGEIERAIERALGPVDAAHTAAPRDAVRLAEQAAREGREAVIAVGGDGTLHEVANGLMRARASVDRLPRLGLVGQGTGGDFRRTLGLPNELAGYCAALGSGKTRAVDVGRFSFVNAKDEPDEAYFINILSVGMGGLVDRHVAHASRLLGGRVAYMTASLRALWENEVGNLACTLHGAAGAEPRSFEVATRSLAICNGRFFGSGMEVAPMATPDDGLLHVVSLGAAGKISFLLSSLAIYSGEHVRNPEVHVWSGERIEVRLRNEEIRRSFLLDVDGEPLGQLPIDVQLVPRAIEVLVGA
ncbi:MAG: diacylglycerol kinase family lipid kinase [Deltaproteobacteria bacterium]|nr:diacylglycerol kinase family lipid kinase [Deltaproteobacteria bacterium]